MAIQVLQHVTGTPFSVYVAGFQITQGPPSPTGVNAFAQSPTTPLKLAACTTSMQLPTQRIPFSTSATPPPTANLSVTTPTHVNYLADHWEIEAGGFVEFQLQLLQPVAVNFAPSFASVLRGGIPRTNSIQLSVNGKKLIGEGAQGNLQLTLPDWGDGRGFPLTPDLFKPGSNSIVFGTQGSGPGDHSGPSMRLRWAEVSSQDVATDVTAYYYWKQLFQGTAIAPGTVGKSVSYTKGTTTSKSTTLSFAESIGVEVGVEYGSVLAKVTAKLNTSFTATQQSTTSISIEESQTTSYNCSVAPTSNERQVTFQFWQPVLEYEAKGKRINEHIDTPIIQTQYVSGNESKG